MDLERVEIYREQQSLMLKKSDVTVARLSSVFKVFIDVCMYSYRPLSMLRMHNLDTNTTN